MSHRALALWVTLFFVSAALAFAERPPRGYQPRACGFDLDDDGIVGELFDDCQVCDGVTTDPDGDGVSEDLYYIDCGGGTDNPSCGSPGSPCATIQYAWDVRADGSADGAEDIFCFRGNCSTLDRYSPPHGGVVANGTYTVPATGSQARDWRYPRDPAMLVGWDSDGDHVYPPIDPDDTAVLAGGGLKRAFRLNQGTSNLEMAHFTAVGYGAGVVNGDTGFVRWGPNAGVIEYQHFHDLKLLRINKERDTLSGVALVDLFPTTATPKWIQFANLDVVENGQWFARGSGYDDKMATTPDMGPFRFTNITRTAYSCNVEDCGTGAGSTVFKLWSFLSGVEILDSVWDANVDNWNPTPSGGGSGSSFANPSQCTRDWVIRNNLILDYKNVLIVDSYTEGFCDGTTGATRPLDDIVFDANEAWNTYEPWQRGDQGIRITGNSPRADATLGDVVITNNFLGSSEGWEAAVWIYAGSQVEIPPGTITIAHNTFYGNPNRHGAIVIGNVEGTDPPIPVRNLRIHHNVIDGLTPFEGTADYAVRTTYVPSGLVMYDNAYDPRGRFGWNGQAMGFSVWKPTSGQDATSVQCRPSFVDTATGDLHLRWDDPCAVDHGGAPEAGVTIDFDGEPRIAPGVGNGTLDIGADEVGAAIFADGFESGNVFRWASFSGR